MQQGSANFVCILCKRTLDQLKKHPDDTPITHTNFGKKGDAHELCGSCWNRERLKLRNKPRPHKKFTCANCGLDEDRLKKLSKISRYYGKRHRLPGDSKYLPAQYCGSCYAKLRKEKLRALTHSEPTQPITTPVEPL